MSRAGNLRSSDGFTLLELLIVLALMATVMAVVVAKLPAGSTETQAVASAKELAAGLRLARGEAIRSNREVAFVLDLEKRSFRVADQGIRQVPDGVSMALYTASSEIVSTQIGSIRFFPDGSSTGGRVHVRRVGEKKDSRIVSIDWVTGRVSVSE